MLRFLVVALPLVLSKCPYASQDTAPLGVHPALQLTPEEAQTYKNALAKIDFDAVKADIRAMLTVSQDFWPADYGNYGPFLIRQAWHCSGSYRVSDGRGGCDGGRQRFDPERSWDDNTNLDKAKTLLWPIKMKYGVGLSWGDLIVLAGTTAIESMGGPSLGFCAGRVDAKDGSESALLGPTAEQEALLPCAVNGKCELPFGTTTIGLIYVNPEGPMGVPDPEGSAHDVRSTFARMAMNDSETVALIGGGHAFGKTHGACSTPPGPPPSGDPVHPWKGNCGTGKGADTFTSGFEGPWTTNPTEFDNGYFLELLNNNWTKAIGPGGHYQWHVSDASKKIMMLTSDISLTKDPANGYQQWVQHYAANPDQFSDAFSHAWYKLTTRDMGPASRCVGNNVPPAQPFQYPLPPAPASLPDFSDVRAAIRKVMTTRSPSLAPDVNQGNVTYAPVFVNLAYQCASTFRVTDYMGGCNGARIRFAPQSSWATNTAVDKALALLTPVKEQFGDSLSWADLIVLAGTVGLEEGGTGPIPFCGGRSDALASDPNPSIFLSPNGNLSLSIEGVEQARALMGLTDRELVALSARLRSAQQMGRLGFGNGSWTADTHVVSNEYFVTLLGEQWSAYKAPGATHETYKAEGKSLFMTPSDLAIYGNPEWLVIAQEFASDNEAFLEALRSAWTRLMNVDRFDGPVGNVCDSARAPEAGSSSDNMYTVAGVSAAVTFAVMLVVMFFVTRHQRQKYTGHRQPLI